MTQAVIHPISYADILQAPNAQELFQAYASECALPELGVVAPQGEMYGKLEALGMMQCFGVYRDEVLVGFACVLMSVLPHYGKKVATVESIFVLPEHRRGNVGRLLMLAVEQCADERNCTAILYSAPFASQFETVLFHLPEYRPSNTVFCRRLN